MLGIVDGNKKGPNEGREDGWVDGSVVGEILGIMDGIKEGPIKRREDVNLDGNIGGFEDGSRLGWEVGSAEGLSPIPVLGEVLKKFEFVVIVAESTR